MVSKFFLCFLVIVLGYPLGCILQHRWFVIYMISLLLLLIMLTWDNVLTNENILFYALSAMFLFQWRTMGTHQTLHCFTLCCLTPHRHLRINEFLCGLQAMHRNLILYLGWALPLPPGVYLVYIFQIMAFILLYCNYILKSYKHLCIPSS